MCIGSRCHTVAAVPKDERPNNQDPGGDVIESATRRWNGSPTPDAINDMQLHEFPGAGNGCTELGSNYAVARRLITPAELRPGGYISGPTQFSLADGALWYLVFAAIGRVEPMALTSELSIRFLRPAIGEVLWARATLESAGRRNVVGTVKVWVDDRDDKPTAVAQGTYALPLEPSP